MENAAFVPGTGTRHNHFAINIITFSIIEIISLRVLIFPALVGENWALQNSLGPTGVDRLGVPGAMGTNQVGAKSY